MRKKTCSAGGGGDGGNGSTGDVPEDGTQREKRMLSRDGAGERGNGSTGDVPEDGTQREKRMLSRDGAGERCGVRPNKRQRKALETQEAYEKYKLCVPYPELLCIEDVASPDVRLLNVLKASPHSVPVPEHWREKRGYLNARGGVHKKPYVIPDSVLKTGVCEARKVSRGHWAGLSLKQKLKMRLNPKDRAAEEGRADIEWDAPCPALSCFGDLYRENKYREDVFMEALPGKLSTELAAALGIEDSKTPPPWLHNMQKYGLPPAYPGLKVPGVNAPIPRGCKFGHEKGGWGMPPVGSDNRPLYPDVYATPSDEVGAAYGNRFFEPVDFSAVLCREMDVESRPRGAACAKKVFRKETGTFV